MQPRELEDQVFSHRVVSENGFENIVPVELDPYMRGRAITILEARAIIEALTNTMTAPQVTAEMFQPVHAAQPAEITEFNTLSGKEVATTPASNDPAEIARNAAMSTVALNQQFAVGA